ncbi:MAG: helix-turn-helix domain-containing protein [Paracoccaceae bacterium]
MNDLRLQHGRALLAETDMCMTEVAIACDYASSSHFSKSFRVKYGVSPCKFSYFDKYRLNSRIEDRAFRSLMAQTSFGVLYFHNSQRVNVLLPSPQ